MSGGIHENLASLAIPIASVVLDPANARKHPDRSIESIAASLRVFGQRKPIVVQKEGMVVRAGNGLVEAARSLGWSEIAAVVVDEDAVSATAFALADNRTAETSSWDLRALGEIVVSFDEIEDIDLGDFGWDDGELERLAGIAAVDLDDLVGGFQNEAIARSEADGVKGKAAVTLVMDEADARDVKAAMARVGKDEFAARVGDLARETLEARGD
jgi:ParB-like chromosome segregation protein Spo0J